MDMEDKDKQTDEFEQTWTTDELTRDFEVLGFMAPFVVVRRRSDGKRGTLQFTHMPRLYFGWQSTTEEREE